MNEPRRLFDCIAYHLERAPLDELLAGKEGGQYKKYSAQKISDVVMDLSAGLLSLGIGPGDMSVEGRDKVAILCKNRPEWVMLDLAVQQIGAVLTPIYPTININELKFVLNDAQVKMVFVNDEELFLKVMSVKGQVASLKEIYTFEHVANAKHWKEILALSTPALQEQIKIIAGKINYEDLATIIYTSGTTGTPKGVMLSHRNILSNVMACIPCFPPGEKLRALSFLPLNHIFERMVTYLYLFKGTSVYYAESFDTIGENLKEVQPHIFTTVPRLLEKVYDRIMKKGQELSGVKKKLFFWAHGLAERFEINKPMSFTYKFQLALANKIIFSKWREGLGNNIVCIVSGGAACQVRLIRIFTAAKIPIMEGYGLTETSPVIAVNRFVETDRMFGTVGPIIEGIELRIVEDGEILCKGPNVMMGYYKRPELTAQELTDGWYHTGDIGTIIENKFLKITDRKKELFKTSGGKYVAPLPIENKLMESPFIEQVMLIGAEKKFVSALIVPSFSNLRDWARKNNINDSGNEDMIASPKVIEMFRELIESFNKFFNHVEQVKKFELLAHEWSVDTGEMTPKLSLKRKVIMEKYRDAIERDLSIRQCPYVKDAMLTSGSFRVKTGYLTAFLLLLMSYILIFTALQQFLTHSKLIEHTDLVITELETLSSYMNEAESAARGYTLLNDPDHLQTFYTSTKRIDSLLKNIDSVTSDNISQQKKADTLKMLIQDKLGGMYRGVLLFKEAGYVVTEEMKSRGEVGKKLMIGIRTIIKQMEQSEKSLLLARKEKLRAVSISIKVITITSLIIALLLSLYSFVTYSRESSAKLKADEQADSYRKQLENKLIELQEANAELQELRSLEKFTATGRIARTIAHEIRDPLTNIALASEQIKADSDRDEETIMLLDMINRNANRINQMITDLLSSTKFAQLQYSKTNINSLLDETLELAKDRIELKQIKLEKNYSDPGSEVFVDAEKMKIAFLNIIVNAIEAIDKDQGILEIRTTKANDKCMIDIKDNGCGMNEETLLKLFDPYFTKKMGGNGLGLTNTQNIILNHRGSIQVKSEQGEGSVFTIILNIA